MRKSSWLIPVLFAAIVVPYANADSISDSTTITTQADPKYKFVCCNGEPATEKITDLTVSFTIAFDTIPVFSVTGPVSGLCTPSLSPSGFTAIDTCAAILPKATFVLVVPNADSVLVRACWSGPGIVGCSSPATPVPNPEPATGGLMLVGIGFLFVMRRRIGQSLLTATCSPRS
jgi:hypothetical protein